MMRKVWNQLWWRDGSSHNLAAVRIIIAGHALWILLSRNLAAMSSIPVWFWNDVAVTARWRYLLFPGHSFVETTVQGVAVVALLATLLGVRARTAAFIAAVSLYHLAPLQTIIWTASPFERGFEIAVLSLVVLSIAPCDHAWSLQRGDARDTALTDYHWPVMLIQLFVAQIYLFSGYAKLFRVGFEWISADNLRTWLLVFNQQDQFAVFTTLGPWLAQHETLLWISVVGAMVVDLGFISVLFSQRARWFFLPAATAFHLFILLGMNIAFLNFPQLFVFLPWHRIAQAARTA